MRAGCVESRRSGDACCPDPCKRVGRGRCGLRADPTGGDGTEQDGGGGGPEPERACASCNPPADTYTVAAASVLAAGITAAALYYSR